MKRWTNGLPGATKRLGAKMALQGLSPSESRMRADTHDGPEHIDAALTFVDLGSPSCTARPGHTSWHFTAVRDSPLSGLVWGVKRTGGQRGRAVRTQTAGQASVGSTGAHARGVGIAFIIGG